MEIKAGQNFLNYTIVKEIGKGGFGAVYFGEKINPKSDDISPAAIKILHEKFNKDQKIVHRFHREAKLAKKLNHPNVVRILEHGVYQDSNYIIMEYAKGVTFLDFINSGKLTKAPSPESNEKTQTMTLKKDELDALQEGKTVAVSRNIRESVDKTLILDKREDPEDNKNENLKTAVEIMKQCASVLQSAHEIGLVHRDIKPENILVKRDEQNNIVVKILDFGLAKNLVDQSIQISVAGQAMGTPAFMSPEQFQGKDLDTRSDLYSLGVTFYAYLTGTLPFPGPTIKDFMKQVLYMEAESPLNSNPGLNKDFVEIIDKLMKKNPKARYQTPKELFADLDRFQRNEKPLHLKRKNLQVILLSLIGVLILLGLFLFFLFLKKQTHREIVPNQEKKLPVKKIEHIKTNEESNKNFINEKPRDFTEKITSVETPSITPPVKTSEQPKLPIIEPSQKPQEPITLSENNTPVQETLPIKPSVITSQTPTVEPLVPEKSIYNTNTSTPVETKLPTDSNISPLDNDKPKEPELESNNAEYPTVSPPPTFPKEESAFTKHSSDEKISTDYNERFKKVMDVKGKNFQTNK